MRERLPVHAGRMFTAGEHIIVPGRLEWHKRLLWLPNSWRQNKTLRKVAKFLKLATEYKEQELIVCEVYEDGVIVDRIGGAQ